MNSSHRHVSVIIAAFNAAPWIAATLRSAQAQTHHPLEIIVIDDGSTDGTAATAATVRDDSVLIVRQANAGAAAARNHGLQLARGEYIQFLDADDLLAPDKIARQVAALSVSPADSLAAGEWGRFTDDPNRAAFNAEAVYQATNGVEFLQLQYETGSMMQPGGWLAPRHLLDRAGPWDEHLSLNDDGEYFARVMLAAERICFTPGARCYYRASPRSLSRRRDRASMLSLHRSVELTLAQLLARDGTIRTRAAAAYAWKWTAFELYPAAPDLADDALRRSHALGGSPRPFPGGRRFGILSRLLGWKAARRITST